MCTRRLCKLALILLGNHALWTVPATQNTRVVQDIDTGLNKQLSHLRGSQSRVVFQQGRKQLHSLDRRKCSAAAAEEARSGRVVAAGAAAEANGEDGENRTPDKLIGLALVSFLPSSRGEKKSHFSLFPFFQGRSTRSPSSRSSSPSSARPHQLYITKSLCARDSAWKPKRRHITGCLAAVPQK